MCLLAAFLRGEITNEEAMRLLNAVGALSVPSVQCQQVDRVVDFCPAFVALPKGAEHYVSLPRERWDEAVRWLALLKTDLNIVTEVLPGRRRWGPVAISGALIIVFLAIMYAVFGLSWQLWIFGWGGAFWLSILLALLTPKAPPRWRQPFEPFESKAAWEMVQPLVGQFRLPDYDPVKHMQPIPRRRMGVGEALATCAGVLFVVILLAVVSILTGPVYATLCRLSPSSEYKTTVVN